eukprot:612935-Amphidinium_carterae.5
MGNESGVVKVEEWLEVLDVLARGTTRRAGACRSCRVLAEENKVDNVLRCIVDEHRDEVEVVVVGRADSRCCGTSPTETRCPWQSVKLLRTEVWRCKG